MTPEQAKTATLDELRDWLAEDDGWHLNPPSCGGHFPVIWWRYTLDSTVGTRTWQKAHPYPLTRDGAANALPKGWTFGLAWGVWYAQRVYPASTLPKDCDMTPVETPDTGNEIDNRYRLAVLCRLAEKGVAK